jgi:hypothetical protein
VNDIWTVPTIPPKRRGIQTPIKSSVGEFRGIQTPIKLSLGAICQGNSDTHQIIARSNLRGIQTPIKLSVGEFRGIQTPIKLSVGEFRHPSNYRSEQFAKGIRTPIKLSVGAICEDIGFRSRASLRDRAHRDDRRVCVITCREKLNGSPRQRDPGPRVERARRPLSSSSESVMEMKLGCLKALNLIVAQPRSRSG